MISGDEFRATLRDGRAVWLDGRRVDDVTTHPLLRKSVDWVAGTYDESVGTTNGMYRAPRSQDELREQMEVPLSRAIAPATTAGCMAGDGGRSAE